MNIASQLGQLETSGLVRIAQLHPELEYIFRHAMVQDAVYESLLKQDRRRLHRMVGETLERAYPNRIEEMAAMLGTHFALAEDSERALHYCLIAARAAGQRYANSEAITHYGAALELALATKVTGPLHELYLGLGKALRLTGQFQQAMAYYDAMQAHAEASDNQAMLLDALTEQATIYATSTPLHDSERALTLCDQALGLARDLDQPAAEAKILWNMMLGHKFNGYGKVGLVYGEQALEIARSAGDATLLAYLLNDLGSQGYLDTAQFPLAAGVLQEASERWRDLQNPHMLTDSLASLSIVRWVMGDYPEALKLAREAWRVADSVGNQWGKAHSLWSVPHIYGDWGRYEDAITAGESALEQAEASGFIAGTLGASSILAFIYMQVGQIERSLDVALKAQQVVDAHLPAWSAWIHGCVGLMMMEAGTSEAYEAQMAGLADYQPTFDGSRIAVGEMWVSLAKLRYALITGQPDGAVWLADQVIDGMTNIGMRAHLHDFLLLKAQGLVALGRDAEAHDLFEQVRQQSEAAGLRRVLWQALAGLADLAEQQGDVHQAADLRQQAAEVLRFIEQRIQTPEFRESFLALPKVSAVLEGVQ